MTDTPAPRLTIALAGMAERLDQLTPDTLPPLPGVVWHLFIQGPADRVAAARPRLTAQGRRRDIRLSALESRGVARSRNAALAAVETELLLFADDDLTFHPAGIAALIDRFDRLPRADLLCARLTDETGRPRKRYVPDGTPLRWFNCGRVGTPELALRPARVRAAGVRFDPAFGAGQPDWMGDEYIFLCDALRAGLRGWHVDIVPASHPAESSGLRQSPEAMAVRRRVLIRALGRGRSLAVRLAFAWRHRRSLDGWRSWLAFLRP